MLLCWHLRTLLRRGTAVSTRAIEAAWCLDGAMFRWEFEGSAMELFTTYNDFFLSCLLLFFALLGSPSPPLKILATQTYLVLSAAFCSHLHFFFNPFLNFLFLWGRSISSAVALLASILFYHGIPVPRDCFSNYFFSLLR